MMKNLAEEILNIQMGIFMKDTGKIIKKMVMEL